MISLNIPMPENCRVCPLMYDYFRCNAAEESFCEKDFDICEEDHRPDWCPLVDSGPHVMTLEEVENALDTVVWVDVQGVENISCMYALIEAYSYKRKYVVVRYFSIAFVRDIPFDWYGKYIRFWNARPTDKQREAAKWDVGSEAQTHRAP